MDEYKAAFKEKTGKEWAYQDANVEDDYMKFKEDRDKEDTENGDGSFAGRKELTAQDLQKINAHKGLQLDMDK